jgi:hypothetical protein
MDELIFGLHQCNSMLVPFDRLCVNHDSAVSSLITMVDDGYLVKAVSVLQGLAFVCKEDCFVLQLIELTKHSDGLWYIKLSDLFMFMTWV